MPVANRPFWISVSLTSLILLLIQTSKRHFQREAETGGLWTSKKVKIHIQEHFGIEVTEVCAWGHLKRLGFPVQVPRPTHTEAASPKEQGAFIKKSGRR
ncbi:helix-turn-helix domain-containing protein [Deinococcus hopiensis]|uniref:helix-turn-helix domain-containing protein n=1 Tax=Deinococcus hopiensis TaxID=309885 RepID=UPI000A03ED87